MVRKFPAVLGETPGIPQKWGEEGWGRGYLTRGLWVAREACFILDLGLLCKASLEEMVPVLRSDPGLPPIPVPGFCGFQSEQGDQ